MKVARKLRKLVRDPNQFFLDYFAKRAAQRAPVLSRQTLQRLSDDIDYSVIAAVYGVEPYLEKFLESITGQTIGFESRIELVLVDDGSPDNSVEIIERWRRKYPNSIKLVRKENGGQSSARNVGLENARGNWVTFIDPDDFVSQDYFAVVDDFLARCESEVAAACCKTVYYKEAEDKYQDSHPLRSRYARAERVVDMIQDSTVFNLQTTNTFMRRSVIERAGLRFDERVRPTFEDAKFFNLYTLACSDFRVAFLSKAIYYYRKRGSRDSSIDTSWRKAEQFTTKLEHGYLDLLRAYRRVHGSIPVFLQNLILYDLSWYFGYLLDRNDQIDFLTPEQCERFEFLLAEIFRELDIKVLLDSDRTRLRPIHKFGIMSRFLRAEPVVHVSYIQPQLVGENLAEIRFYTSTQDDRTWQLWDGARAITPAHHKQLLHQFNRSGFVCEHRLFVYLSTLQSDVSLTLGEQKILLRLGRRLFDSATPAMIRQAAAPVHRQETHERKKSASALIKLASSSLAQERYGNAWLFMDRDVQADDNAEHLYRWVTSNTSHKNPCFFVLRRGSHDWARLKREGFRLIPFGGLEHRIALLNAEWLISSHADQYVVSYLPRAAYGRHIRYKFAFLQHGIIKDDLSEWLNKKPLDLFVTSTPAEHQSIVQGPYKFTDREVALTGLPRHDALLEKAKAEPRKDLVLIMPTWRNYLLGKTSGMGNLRDKLDNFVESDYFRHWQAVIGNAQLTHELQTAGLQPYFFPHANMQKYLTEFSPAPGMSIGTHDEVLMQDLFARCALLITDYSSVAFDVAILRRPVIYFQFDRTQVMTDHIYRPGYFDYDRDGFGAVCSTSEEVASHLSQLVRAGCQMPDKYLARANATFVAQDGRCCESVYNAIRARSVDATVPAG